MRTVRKPSPSGRPSLNSSIAPEKTTRQARRSSLIAQALAETGHAQFLYLAGKDWSRDLYDDVIAQALIATRDAEYLYHAGKDWPEARYRDAIWHALLTTSKKRWINKARKTWSPSRLTHAEVQAVHM